ncbi:AsmA family protein [Thiomicrorhabdus sediminis]|uniref:AsmA family protein n=1 Tax=Thiomicrorhabdus sediminis TaxID=2580412 RepID=A0A4P9K7A7_9GAMM|nr:AsmA family protein [Thiomicrorhabdus sediminis]QCU90965.1 AsmA family protein [Thiomicrorhabdus sediminis]
MATKHSETRTENKNASQVDASQAQCQTVACPKRRFKWTRRLLTLLITIPILLFLAFAGAVKLMDFNQYKPQIEKEIAELTQREFVIDGDIEVSVLPFMLSIGQMTLKNPQGFEQPNLLTIKEAQLELSLPDLFLEQNLNIKSLELIEPSITFIKRENDNNWQDMPLFASLDKRVGLARLQPAMITGQQANMLVEVANAPAQKATAPVSASNEKWVLENFSVQDAQVRFINQVDDFEISLKQVDLLAFDVLPHEPFRINSHFIYEHSESPRTFEFEVNAKLALSDDYSQLYLSDWNGVFRLQLPREDNRPDIRLATSGKNLMVDFRHQQLYVHKAQLKGLNAEVETSFQGEYGANPSYKGEFSAESIDIPRWLDSLGLPMPEGVAPQALKNTAGKFSWSWDGQWLKLDKIDLQLKQQDKADAKLSGKISWALQATGQSTFDLQISALDSNALAQHPAKTEQGAQFNHIDQALLALISQALKQQLDKPDRGDKLLGKLQLADVRVANVGIKQINAEIHVKDKRLEIAPLDIEFAQGKLTSQFAFNGKTQQLSWQGGAEKLSLGAFLPSNKSLDGVLDSRFYWRTQGIKPAQWQQNLNGLWNNRLTQAKVYGMDVNGLLGGEIVLHTANLAKQAYTEFSRIDIQGSWQQGIYAPKRFSAQSERFQGNGYFSWNLFEEQIEGQLLLTLQASNLLTALLQGSQIKLLFAGPVAAPKWSINLAQSGQS